MVVLAPNPEISNTLPRSASRTRTSMTQVEIEISSSNSPSSSKGQKESISTIEVGQILVSVPPEVQNQGIVDVNIVGSSPETVSEIIEIFLYDLDGNLILEPQFEQSVQLCFPVNSKADCLAYRQRAEDTWKCTDECLTTYDSKNTTSKYLQCGSTTHFTQFALLLTGANYSGDKCHSFSGYITGSSQGDLILVLCVSLGWLVFLCILIICASLGGLRIPLLGNLVYGEEGFRIVRTRDSALKFRRLNLTPTELDSSMITQ
jgi:hypothetical protein